MLNFPMTQFILGMVMNQDQGILQHMGWILSQNAGMHIKSPQHVCSTSCQIILGLMSSVQSNN